MPQANASFILIHWTRPRAGRELQRGKGTPPWLTKMKGDGEAIRLQDEHSSELILWMVMDCLYGRLPSRLSRLLWLCSSLQGHRGLFREDGPWPTELKYPWWSHPGPIRGRSEVISTAPERAEGRRRTKEEYSLDSERGRGREAALLISNQNRKPSRKWL